MHNAVSVARLLVRVANQHWKKIAALGRRSRETGKPRWTNFLQGRRTRTALRSVFPNGQLLQRNRPFSH